MLGDGDSLGKCERRRDGDVFEKMEKIERRKDTFNREEKNGEK